MKARQKAEADVKSPSSSAGKMSIVKRTLRENMEEPLPRRYSARNDDDDMTL